MKKLATLVFPALLFAACQSTEEVPHEQVDNATSSLGASAAEVPQAKWTGTVEHHDSRQLLNRLRGFLAETEVAVLSRDSSEVEVRGSVEEVALVRHLIRTFDHPIVTGEHRAVTKDFEQSDARLALNSVRGHEDWGQDWVVGANSADRWYAMIPDGELDRFNALVDELDRSN